jgi:molybdopterin converting factor small subunit
VGSARVRVRLYATARVAAGRGSVDLDVPIGGLPARDLLRRLAREYPDLTAVLGRCRFVRNAQFLSNLGVRIRPGDEFAVHPPYGGG